MPASEFTAPFAASDFSSAIDDAICNKTTGTVDAIIGNRIEVRGFSAPTGAICRIHSSSGGTKLARVIGFRQDTPILAGLDEIVGVSAGDIVQLASHDLRVPYGDELMGRVLDGIGRPIDGSPLPSTTKFTSCGMTTPSSVDRPPIRKVFETGIRAMDGMLTLGVGQRVGVFAGAGVGKSTLLGMLARTTSADAVVIGLVGERGREVRDFIDDSLGERGMKRSTVVVSTNDESAPMRIQAAWTATAIASALRETGKNVLLLMDSITRFATAQREIGLAVGEPPTTRGYPPSVFGQLPKLVEQAGQTKQGSITAIYSVLVDGDDTNEPISDTLRGLLDGHVILSRKLAAEGHWPAIDIPNSLSRLQTKLVAANNQTAATRVRKRLADYQASEDLINIGAYRSGANPDVDKAIENREAIRQFLTQGSDEFTKFEETLQTLNRLAL